MRSWGKDLNYCTDDKNWKKHVVGINTCTIEFRWKPVWQNVKLGKYTEPLLHERLHL